MLKGLPDISGIPGFLRRNKTGVILWGAFAVLFYPVFRNMYATSWRSLDYDHAYFILPICIYIAWKERAKLAAVLARAKGDKMGPLWGALLVMSVAMYVFGWKWDYMFICAISFIPAGAAITGLIYGTAVLKHLWFAFFYLLFMIPPPAAVLDSITLPMRYISSEVAYRMMGLAGYEVIKNGLVLKVGDFTAVVANACSGFRSFITLTALGILYIYLFAREEKLIYKIVLIGLIPVLAIVGNSLRVCVIVLLGHYYGAEVAEGFLHSTSGLIVYLFMVMGLLAADRGMTWLLAFSAKKRTGAGK
jgi:exosortase